MTLRRLVLAIPAIALFTLVPALEQASAPTLQAASRSPSSPEAVSEMVADYCVMCHNDASRTAGLSLEAFDAERPENDAATSEKILRKLHTGMMPPSFAPQPVPETVTAFVSTLETRIDEDAARTPNPGRRPFQRLNAPSTPARERPRAPSRRRCASPRRYHQPQLRQHRRRPGMSPTR
jgi:hypothetical protein